MSTIHFARWAEWFLLPPDPASAFQHPVAGGHDDGTERGAAVVAQARKVHDHPEEAGRAERLVGRVFCFDVPPDAFLPFVDTKDQLRPKSTVLPNEVLRILIEMREQFSLVMPFKGPLPDRAVCGGGNASSMAINRSVSLTLRA